MDGFHWFTGGLLIEQRLRDLADERERWLLEREARADGHAGLRVALAATLVRWGLRLDPTAGERAAAPAGALREAAARRAT